MKAESEPEKRIRRMRKRVRERENIFDDCVFVSLINR